jgi:hypothetical protein
MIEMPADGPAQHGLTWGVVPAEDSDGLREAREKVLAVRRAAP